MAKVYDNATDIITFARGSSATYTGSDGTQQTAASDEPRIEYAADGTLKGLLIEEQRTNLLLNSDNPDTQVASLAAGSHTLSFVGGPSVTGISDSITANAVDVFVYDTSKDSDGGAWRTGSLAQASSWYAEASSPTRDPETRSTRAEFPAVAVIVAESNKVTIYDGDDPSLPMWMVFTENNNNMLDGGGNLSSLAALNGTICVGDATVRLSIFDFIGDRGAAFNSSQAQTYRGNFAQRNETLGHDASGNWLSNDPIVNNAVNDVAMTVLPDAPTDPATGLPVPTIAVATDGGVSVIKDDGTIVDSAVTYNHSSVAFSDGRLIGLTITNDRLQDYGFVGDILADGFIQDKYYNKGTKPSLITPTYTSGHSVKSLAGDYLGQGLGLNSLSVNTNDYATGMVAYTTSSYNTGWMPGDIKLAALADTDEDDLVGAEYHSDPACDSTATFASPNADWSFNADVADVNTTTAGKLHIKEGTTGFVENVGGVIPAGTGVAITFTISGSTANIGVRVALRGGTNLSANDGDYFTADGTYTVYFSPEQVPAECYAAFFRFGDHTGTLDIDNISVRLADPDRSVKGNGLAVHGSITKAPVATGADLVAYSGFSASNYLEQPYNPDLNFGQGDFCYMGWLTSGPTPTSVMLSRGIGDQSNTNDAVAIAVTAAGALAYRHYDATGSLITAVVGSTNVALGTSVWKHFVILRKNGVIQMYVDGVLDTLSSNTNPSGAVGGTTSPKFAVGKSIANVWNTLPWGVGGADSSLALLRISATAPTADQIAKIYNDERPLFQENAKATLTGNSDAVTALAHDPDTNLLHVGTSGGRSVFYGLRRVNETATAVTTAISAVDGLIVEQ